MKIISLLWGFSLGGIGKVAITYGQLGNNSDLEIFTLCIQPQTVNVDISPLKQINSKVIFIKNRFDLSWIKKVRCEIDNYKPDKLFVHGFNGPVIGWALQKFWYPKLKLVCSYHGLYHAPYFSRQLFTPLLNYLPIVIYRNYSEKVITVANYSKAQLIKKKVPEEIIKTVYNGIPAISQLDTLNSLKLNNMDGVIHIGYIGRLDPVKGINTLISAIQYVRIKFNLSNWDIHIIGNGPILLELKAKVTELNLQQKVNFVGRQNNIAEWLNSLDIFVLPSYLEAHSISLLEAMRAGNAIIATNVGGNSESIRDGIDGLLVPPKNKLALAEALSKLINSSSLRSQLGTSAQKRYKELFTEEIMKKNLVAALKS